MQITPRVFVSAVTSELKSARQEVNKALIELECLPIEQSHFGTQYGQVQNMLRQQIASCQALVHIVGRGLGGEPNSNNNPRRSWTQIEYDLALELGKRVYVIVCNQDFPFDTDPQSESLSKTTLQAEHRKQVLHGQHLWYQVNDTEDLRDCLIRLKLPLDVVRRRLRRQQLLQRLLIGATAAAVVLAVSQIRTAVDDAAVSVRESVETTGVNTQETIEAMHRRSDAKLDQANEHLLLVELGLENLHDVTRDLVDRLNGVSDLNEVKLISGRLDDLLADVDRELDTRTIPASGVRVIRDAKGALLRATMRLEQYPINPPDILVIEGIALVPRGPRVVRNSQKLFIDSTDPRLKEVALRVGSDGMLVLPDQIGSVAVGGKSLAEAEKAVVKLLNEDVDEPIVIIVPADPEQLQQPISGEHLVAPDGRVTLGVYGQVYVAGMSVPAARQAIEEHLAEYFEQPQVAVSVSGYNSLVIYLVFEHGSDSTVHRLPYFGRQSVMDAVAMLGGPPGQVVRTKLANPDLPMLEVDWSAILAGDFSTDYQVFPDDRIVMTLDDVNNLDLRDNDEASASAPPPQREERARVSPYLNLGRE